MALVDVVVVHYNTPGMLRDCLESLYACPTEDSERVVVIDNASPDRTVEQIAREFPQAEFLFNPANVGFAAACNQGVRATESAHCLLLNPDALIGSAAIQSLLAFMATHADAGVVAPRMLNPGGSLQWSCRRFPTLRAVLLRASRLDRFFPAPVDRYLMRDWDHAQAHQVDWAIGACLLVRRAALVEVGMLDEAYFMYHEDTDLCRRMQAAGWGVYYEPVAVVQHEHRRESADLLPGRAIRSHLRSLVRLFRKHRFQLW